MSATKTDADTGVHYYEQSNRARYAYTVSPIRPRDNRRACRLRSGSGYLYKQTKCDELIAFTESKVACVARTIAFMYAFGTSARPTESMYDIVASGRVRHLGFDNSTRVKESLGIGELIAVLDAVIGDGFSAVAHRSVTRVFYEYSMKWKRFNYGVPARAPSAQDYIDTYRFLKVPVQRSTKVTEFIISRHNLDNRVPLQQRVKRLLP